MVAFQQQNLKSFNYANNLLIRKASDSSNTGRYDQSIRTSPFNKDTATVENNTNSSYLRSTKNVNSKDDDWNEDELYNLSHEVSKDANLHEIVEVQAHIDKSSEINIKDTSKEIQFTDNTQDYNICNIVDMQADGKQNEENRACNETIFKNCFNGNEDRFYSTAEPGLLKPSHK